MKVAAKCTFYGAPLAAHFALVLLAVVLDLACARQESFVPFTVGAATAKFDSKNVLHLTKLTLDGAAFERLNSVRVFAGSAPRRLETLNDLEHIVAIRVEDDAYRDKTSYTFDDEDFVGEPPAADTDHEYVFIVVVERYGSDDP